VKSLKFSPFFVGNAGPNNFEEPLVRELLGLLNSNTMSLLPETTLEAILSFLSNVGGRADCQSLLVTVLFDVFNFIKIPNFATFTHL
jgi:hypothetical protein